MGRLQARLDVLPAAQRALWRELQDLGSLGWVLYGGTAIALRLGHRVSVDFDFFHDKPLDRDRLSEACPGLVRSIVVQQRPDTLTVLMPVGTDTTSVKVSFFGGLGFGRVGEPDVTSEGAIEVASADDLLAHKLKVLLQRVEAKDYLDIAALLDSGLRLDQGLAWARALFGGVFQPSESLKALVYFEGGDLHTLPAAVKETLIAAARRVRDLPAAHVVSRTLSAS